MTVTGSLVHDYTPRGSARQLFEDRSGEIVLSGPAGTGKSRACMEKLHLMMLANPGARGLIVRKTHASLTTTGLVTWRRDVVAEMIATGDVRFYGGSAEQSAQYRYANGSTVVVGGMDRATRIMSSEYDVIYVQEATELTENDWESLTTRLRNWRISFQQIIGDCNPDRPDHWLKVRSSRNLKMYTSLHRDNPRLYDEAGQTTTQGAAYMDKLNQLTGVRADRLLRGVWASAEGIVYDEFRPDVHLVDWHQVPQSWPRYWVIDWGYTNPFVCQHWAQDQDGRLIMYREFYMTGKTVDQHAAEILFQVTRGEEKRWIEPKPRFIVCDHDPGDRATFSRAIGLPTIPANKKVGEGIQIAKARMRVAGDGRPRMVLMRDALVARDPELIESKRPTCTQEEFPGYVWDASKDQPVKQDDHGMDCVRYLAAELDNTKKLRVRSF